MYQSIEESRSKNCLGAVALSLIIYNTTGMKRKYIIGLVLIIVIGTMIGVYLYKLSVYRATARVAPTRNDGGKISVVASFYPLYFITSEIGGEKIEVKNMTPAGVEPHDYEPTARDMMDIQRAKLLILNGGKFEAWGEKINEDLKNTGVIVVEAGQGLFEGNDPHVWLSPELVKKQSRIILESLVQINPVNEVYYNEKAKILDDKLNKLQTEYLSGLVSCQRREFVTSHDAFGYLASEFGLTQVPIAGLTPEEEPSTKLLTEIVRFVKEREIKYIFFERLASPKLAETIAEEVGIKILVLDPIEGISDNDMEQGKNYFSLMEENLANLRIALECQ